MDTRLPNLLHDLASQAPVEDEASTRLVVRRARTRRIATSLVASAVVVVVIVGTVSVVRTLTPADTQPIDAATGDAEPTPTGVTRPIEAFPGLWPETTAEALAAAQAQVDDGHSPLRLDPAQTAAMLATGLFGWQPDEVMFEHTAVDGPDALVRLSNRVLGDPIPTIDVKLAQLGRTGSDGIWSVVAVTSSLFDEPVAVDIPDGGGISFTGTLTDQYRNLTQQYEGIGVRFEVLLPDGPETQPILWATVDTEGLHFEGASPDGPAAFDGAVLWIHVVDQANTTLGALALPLGDIAEPAPTGSTGPGRELPSAVLATRDAIASAAAARDFDALETLIDPNHFAYNFSDGSNPVPEWRKDPTPLDALATILEMPFTTTEGTPELGTISVWPALVDADLTNLTQDERAMLDELGITDRDVKDMLDAFGGYVGPRTGIAEDGTWVFFTIGGD